MARELRVFLIYLFKELGEVKRSKVSKRGHMWSADPNIFYLVFYIKCLLIPALNVTCMLPAAGELTTCKVSNVVLSTLRICSFPQLKYMPWGSVHQVECDRAFLQILFYSINSLG